VNSALSVEVLGWLGIPAMQHGNLIEVSTGTVGVDEACSGIRSFQTSLMVSLFFGEFYRMNFPRRLLLIPAGFMLAMAFNVCRVTILSAVAAKKGIGAIFEYHDPAGIAITIVCTAGLWALALFFKTRTSKAQTPKSEGQETAAPTSDLRPLVSDLSRLAIALSLWLILVEASVEAWYRVRESHLRPGQNWSLAFPNDNPTLKTLPIDAKTEHLLRFNEGKQAAWDEPDGSRWQAFFCSWYPGRVAGYLAKRHTPEICMPASGRKLVSGPKLTILSIHGAVLPVRSYVFEIEGELLNVFHCRWEAGVDADAYVDHESARYNLVRGIWAGRGNHGQKVLEMIVFGYSDPRQAEVALVRQLEKLVVIEKPEGSLQRAGFARTTHRIANQR
jgi:exosortase/archaeosortase family protein